MPFQFKLIVFIVASAGLVWLSWQSLRDRRSHGFYRFLAFESIVALVLVNLDCWFHQPFSLRQVASWLLIIICLYLLIHSVLLLRRTGRPDKNRDDPSLIGIEKTSHLVTEGIYRYIRHPIYSAGLIGTWGIFLKSPSLVAAGLSALATLFWILTARREEVENVQFFGAAYQDYRNRTRMFIPFLF